MLYKRNRCDMDSTTHKNQVHQNTEERLDRLSQAANTGSLLQLKSMLSAMHPAEIAHFLETKQNVYDGHG